MTTLNLSYKLKVYAIKVLHLLTDDKANTYIKKYRRHPLTCGFAFRSFTDPRRVAIKKKHTKWKIPEIIHDLKVSHHAEQHGEILDHSTWFHPSWQPRLCSLCYLPISHSWVDLVMRWVTTVSICVFQYPLFYVTMAPMCKKSDMRHQGVKCKKDSPRVTGQCCRAHRKPHNYT